MRVIAGELKGRTLHAPSHTGTRPTSDRVREALFSSLTSRLGSDLDGADVLDAFAGSGALGIEALSRGARSVTFVERDKAALMALRRNVRDLGLEQRTTIIPGDTFSVLKHARIPGAGYSLLFLDPPYRISKTEVTGLLSELGVRGALAADALVVWEYGSGGAAGWPQGFVSVGTRRYGSTVVEIARWDEEGSGR